MKRESIRGVWGVALSGVPLVGSMEAKAPEAKSILYPLIQKTGPKIMKRYKLKY